SLPHSRSRIAATFSTTATSCTRARRRNCTRRRTSCNVTSASAPTSDGDRRRRARARMISLDPGARTAQGAALPAHGSRQRESSSIAQAPTLGFDSAGRATLRVQRARAALHRRLLAVVLLLLIGTHCIGAPASEDATTASGWVHAYATYGAPKYPRGFAHFDYVNPDAPKGGTLYLRNPDRRTSFDKFNPFTVKGNSPAGVMIFMF